MDSQANETLTAPQPIQGIDNKVNPFNVIAEQNADSSSTTNTDNFSYAGSDTTTPQHIENLPPDAEAELNMMGLREQIEAAKLQAHAQAGGENTAGLAHYDEPTNMNATEPLTQDQFERRIQNLTPTEKNELVSTSEYPSEAPNQLQDEAVPPAVTPSKKGMWVWTPNVINKFIQNLEDSGLIPRKTDSVMVKAGKMVLLPVKIPGRIIKAAWNGFKNWYTPPQAA